MLTGLHNFSRIKEKRTNILVVSLYSQITPVVINSGDETEHVQEKLKGLWVTMLTGSKVPELAAALQEGSSQRYQV